MWKKMCGLKSFFECGHIFRNGREQYLTSEENFKQCPTHIIFYIFVPKYQRYAISDMQVFRKCKYWASKLQIYSFLYNFSHNRLKFCTLLRLRTVITFEWNMISISFNHQHFSFFETFLMRYFISTIKQLKKIIQDGADNREVTCCVPLQVTTKRSLPRLPAIACNRV